MKKNLKFVKKLREILKINKKNLKHIFILFFVLSFVLFASNKITFSTEDKKIEYKKAIKRVQKVQENISKIRLTKKAIELGIPMLHKNEKNKVVDYSIATFQKHTILINQKSKKRINFPKYKKIVLIKTKTNSFYWINNQIYTKAKK